MFDESFVDGLPDEPILALQELVDYEMRVFGEIPPGAEVEHYDFFIECYALAKVLAGNIDDLFITIPGLEGDRSTVVSVVHEFFSELDRLLAAAVIETKEAAYERRYTAKFGKGFAYEFSEGDIKKIQRLVNELRQLISESALFEDGHKSRLLKRLERLQSEMHKRVADLDRFWGLVGDAGVVIGKFGNDAKPFVDRIREISDVVWRTQSRAEELPSDTPMDMIKHDDDGGQ